MASGECVYAFLNHRSQQFAHVAVNDEEDKMIAPNANGMLYILHPTAVREWTINLHNQASSYSGRDGYSMAHNILEWNML